MRDSVLIVGGGRMGCGIAAIAAAAGNRVIVVETSPAGRQAGPKQVSALLKELCENQLITSAQKDKALGAVSFAEEISPACERAFFVIEAIVENLEQKQRLFQQLDSLLSPEIPIVSNTSGLRITEIGKLAVHKERLATAHFWFPAHLVPLVEVVMSDKTSQETAVWVRDTLKSWGKAPVIVKKDLPGQLANRILQAVIREASNIVEMGLASPEDVDTAVKMGMGIRFPVWGPLEHVDAVGVDLCCSVQNTVLPGISDKKQANSLFHEMVDQGNLGYKTGTGFYDWKVKDMKKLEKLRNDFSINAVKFIKTREEKD